MIRRFNYTGRRKIPRSCVTIRVREDDERRTFDAVLSLDGLQLPERASVFVEAYHRSAYRRFDFGTVGRPVIPADRRLDGIGIRNPLFRVKIVIREKGIGRILAAADKVLPEQSERAEEGRLPLLPVEYEDLGDRVWALDLDSDWPRLRLNRRWEAIRETARSGAEFVTLVYPEILRAILARSLQDGNFDPDCDDDDWGTLWLRFACRELRLPRPPEGPGSETAEWIEEAVNAFCVRSRVAPAFERLLGARSE